MVNRTMTLGELIAALERKDETEHVRFDFAYFRPDGSIHSYRGYYEQLAIGYTNKFDGKPESEITVGRLLSVLRSAFAREFAGYKGGEYTMDYSTPVWVSQHNEACGTGIVDVADGLLGVVLKTTNIGD